jgi:hypothetical protein
MPALPRVVLATLLLGAVSGAISPAAEATTLVPLTVEEVTDAADLVVRGNVERSWSAVGVNGHVYSYADVRVTEVVKGDVEPGDTLRVDSPGGVLDGVVYDTALAARFSPGEEVLAFVESYGHGAGFQPVGMYLGKYTVKQDPRDGQPMVVRFTVSYHRTFDARFVPNPPLSERVSLDAMLARVKARVLSTAKAPGNPGARGR